MRGAHPTNMHAAPLPPATLLERLAAYPFERDVDRTAQARWLLRLRWVAVVAAALVTWAATGLGRVAPDGGAALWGGVAGLLLFNAVLSWRGAARLTSARGLTVQIAGDALLLAWLVHHAGGLANPFAGFFVFHATTAGVLLEPRAARRVAALIASGVALLALAEESGLLPPPPLLDAAGQPLASGGHLSQLVGGLALAGTVLGTGLIVTTLARALHAERAALSAERGNLQSIIDCMADAVLFVTPDGVIRLRNAAAAALFPEGSPPDADLRSCHPAERWEALLALLNRAEPLTVHPVLPVRGRHYEASWAHVFDTQGRARGVVMAARDITDRIERQSARMQEERMAVVGKLAAGLAHELNNPLGVIALYTQHALSGVPPQEPLAEHLGTVLRNTNLCRGIVQDLLAYARQRPPERRDVLVADLLGDAERTLRHRAATAGARLSIEVAPATDEAIHGDPDQLQQVLVNLGLNAIEAVTGRAGAIVLRAAPEAGGVRFEVEDDGPGIAADEKELVFQAFHTTKSEGTGLGLTVAQDIVASHGGVLTLASEPGRGCIFAFTIGPPGGLLRGPA